MFLMQTDNKQPVKIDKKPVMTEKKPKKIYYVLIIVAIAAILAVNIYMNFTDIFFVVGLDSSARENFTRQLNECVDKGLYVEADESEQIIFHYEICNALIDNSMPDCNKSRDSTDCYDTYYFFKALQESNGDYCNMIVGEDKDVCNYAFDQNLNCDAEQDIKLKAVCSVLSGNTDNIGMSDTEFEMYEKITKHMMIIKNKDIENCKSIQENRNRFLCSAIILNEKSYCNDIKEVSCEDRAYIFITKVYRVKNPLICDKIDDLDTRVDCLEFTGSA
jgi:hypothetical protein